MPYMRPFRSTYVICSANQARAFWVTDGTAAEWTRLCQQAGHGQPRDWSGRRLRPYPELDVGSHRPYAADGIYVDHRDPTVEQAAYQQRDRVLRASNGERQAVLQGIADDHGLRHWRDAYNTVRNVGRRHTGEDGRDRTSGELRWRRWSTRRWSTQGLAAATAQAAASHTRCFGVELEFNHSGSVSTAQARIAHGARLAGLTFTDRWGNYGRNMAIAGWQGTYDSTVTGGEVISDILAGDETSLAEVRTMLAIIRDHGGHAAERQGIHVHHDARDFGDDDKVRLVDNLQALAPVLESYLPTSRQSGHWCRRMTASDWANERRYIAAGRGGSGSHGLAYNFGHLYSASPRVEFRAFGHSLNSAKLRCWIRVGQAIMTATRNGYRFGPAVNTAGMLDALRTHGGLSEAAANRFTDTVDRRSTGRPVAV